MSSISGCQRCFSTDGGIGRDDAEVERLRRAPLRDKTGEALRRRRDGLISSNESRLGEFKAGAKRGVINTMNAHVQEWQRTPTRTQRSVPTHFGPRSGTVHGTFGLLLHVAQCAFRVGQQFSRRRRRVLQQCRRQRWRRAVVDHLAARRATVRAQYCIAMST